jgi:hypothetical protein
VDWTRVLQSGIGALGGVLAARAQARSYVPTGTAAGAIPPWLIGAGGALGGLLGGGESSGGVIVPSTPGIFAGGPGDLLRTSYSNFFRQGSSARLTARRLLPVSNPTNGTVHYWRHVGTPVLFSGDLSHRKRLGKIARKLGGGPRARCKSGR